jgi:hypothetical protein
MHLRYFKAVAIALFAAALLPSASAACSVCRCGDPTFNALGTSIFTQGQFRLALDYESLEKTQGTDTDHHEAEALAASAGLGAFPLPHGDEEHGGREELTERRMILTASYGFSERFQAVARIPWSRREISSTSESISASGLGDPEFYGIFRLWSAPWQEGLGSSSWVSILGGVKTPWGDNDVADEGERLDEHVQPGTGSTDIFAGLSAVHLFDASSTLYGSVQYRKTDRNDHGYLYGDSVLANIGYERKLGKRWDAAVELNARDAGRDEMDADGEEDPNTGGAILFASPRLLVDLGRGIVARLAVQIPVWDDLEGEQEEKTVLNLGLTATF